MHENWLKLFAQCVKHIQQAKHAYLGSLRICPHNVCPNNLIISFNIVDFPVLYVFDVFP